MKTAIIKSMLLFAALVFVSACTHNVGYNASYLPNSEVKTSPVVGGVAIAMSPAEEERVLSAKPSSLTGASTTLNIPVSQIVKSVATETFGAVSGGDVISVSDLQAPAGKRYVVTPTVSTFTYKYDQLSNLGFAITPKVSLSVQVRIRDDRGNILSDKVYRRDDFAKGTYLASVQPHERINKAVHIVAHELMTEAANDFFATVQGSSQGGSVTVNDPYATGS